MSCRLLFAASAILALASTDMAWSQPNSTRPVGSQAGRRLPAVTLQPQQAPSANTVGASTRANDIIESRIEQLEALNQQLANRIALLEAALGQTSTRLTGLQTRFDGHRHGFSATAYDWRNVTVVTAAHATGDDRTTVGSVIGSRDIDRATTPPQ